MFLTSKFNWLYLRNFPSAFLESLVNSYSHRYWSQWWHWLAQYQYLDHWWRKSKSIPCLKTSPRISLLVWTPQYPWHTAYSLVTSFQNRYFFLVQSHSIWTRSQMWILSVWKIKSQGSSWRGNQYWCFSLSFSLRLSFPPWLWCVCRSFWVMT